MSQCPTIPPGEGAAAPRPLAGKAALAFLTLFWLPSAAAGEAKPSLPAHARLEYSETYTRDSLAPVLEPGKVFHVALEGADTNPGTCDAPFGTLERARDAIRRLKKTSGLPAGGVHVVIAPGRYDMTRPLMLSAADSGTAASPIVYRGEGAARAILTGGVSIDSGRCITVRAGEDEARLHPRARGQVMSTDLSGHEAAALGKGKGDYGLLSMDGHVLQLARWPNRGYNHIDRILDAGPTTRWLKPGEQAAPYSEDNPTGGKFTCREPLRPGVAREFQRSRDMRLQGYLHNDWYFQDEPVGAIDGRVIQLLHHTRYGIVDRIKGMPRRVRLVNVLAELDEPGEWYFDRINRRLLFWPIDGFTPGASSIAVAGGPPLIQLEGTEYVTIRDVTFENTGHAAVTIRGGRYNLVGGCAIRNGAGTGIRIEGGKYNGVTGCDFLGLESAMRISGGDVRTLAPGYNFATNNVIHDCRHRGYGVVVLRGVSLRFAHNLLYNLNGSISFLTVNLLMEYNEFYHIGYEMGDFNVAYCGAQWYTMNNVIRFNFVHHLLEPGGYPVMGFRNDDGGAGLKIFGNVFYRSGRGGGQFHGPANDFQNNIVLDAPVMWWTNKEAITPEAIARRWDDLKRFGRDLPKGDKGDYLYNLERAIGKKAWLKSPWKDAFPILGKFIRDNPWAQTYCHVVCNYVYRVREPFHIHGSSGTTQRTEGSRAARFADLPAGCIHELPREITLDAFVDVPGLDLRFKESFEPMPGFMPIPFERIGLVKSEFRPITRDKARYRRAVFERFKDDRTRKYDPEVVNGRYPRPTHLRR